MLTKLLHHTQFYLTFLLFFDDNITSSIHYSNFITKIEIESHTILNLHLNRTINYYSLFHNLNYRRSHQELSHEDIFDMLINTKCHYKSIFGL